MKIINESTPGQDTKVYFYDRKLDLFLSSVTSADVSNLGFRPSHKVTVDADLSAQQIDIVMQTVLFSDLEGLAA